MIYIITGGRSSGKTETVKSLFNMSRGESFGYISCKKYSEGFVSGYDIENLNTGEKTLFIQDKKTADRFFSDYEENSRFLFNNAVYEQVYNETLKSAGKSDNLFLDEIGKLELEEFKGFYKTLIFFLDNSGSKDLYLSVSKNKLAELEKLIRNRHLEYKIIKKISIAAVIMASGSSSRFGNENKLLKKINGESAFSRVIKTVIKSDVFSDIIVVTRYEEIIHEAGKYWNIMCVYNEDADEGISASVKKGVLAADSLNSDGYMFIPCDQLYLTEKTLRQIAAAFIKDSSRIAVPVYSGTRASPMLFPASCRKRLLELTGDRGGRGIISEPGVCISEVEIADKSELRDIDTKEDLAECN